MFRFTGPTSCGYLAHQLTKIIFSTAWKHRIDRFPRKDAVRFRHQISIASTAVWAAFAVELLEIKTIKPGHDRYIDHRSQWDIRWLRNWVFTLHSFALTDWTLARLIAGFFSRCPGPIILCPNNCRYLSKDKPLESIIVFVRALILLGGCPRVISQFVTAVTL